jgi:hypothetical protein
MALENAQNVYKNEPPNASSDILFNFNTNFMHYSSKNFPIISKQIKNAYNPP